jgi:hypothetical protein
MTHINNGGDGYRAGCGATWVDVSYLWDDVDCPACLKLRPTKYAPDVASATSADPLSGLESVPAVEFDTQPRG